MQPSQTFGTFSATSPHVLAKPSGKTVNQEFKNTLRDIGEHPESGTPLEELRALGLAHFRQRLVRQTGVIYEFDDQTVVVHLFIHTRRHFRTHLQERVLRA